METLYDTQVKNIQGLFENFEETVTAIVANIGEDNAALSAAQVFQSYRITVCTLHNMHLNVLNMFELYDLTLTDVNTFDEMFLNAEMQLSEMYRGMFQSADNAEQQEQDEHVEEAEAKAVEVGE